MIKVSDENDITLAQAPIVTIKRIGDASLTVTVKFVDTTGKLPKLTVFGNGYDNR